MFTFFHRNKYNYDKGQVTPYFIVVLVILIMLAMVTVNIGKVALTKTDSANSADAGALAAGSVMANLFDQIAQANSQLEVYFWTSYALISASVAIATAALLTSYTFANSAMALAVPAEASPLPCPAATQTFLVPPPLASAITAASIAKSSILGLAISVTALYASQYYFYLNIRKMAEKGRESAIKVGHQFVFINSGIGSKLKTEERDGFSNFIKGLGNNSHYTYAWTDGQGRAHSVDSDVTIKPVDTFDLKVSTMPFPAEIILLTAASVLSFMVSSSLGLAAADVGFAATNLSGACIYFGLCMSLPYPANLPWCAAWPILFASGKGFLTAAIALITEATANILIITAMLFAAWAGLTPLPVISDSDGITAAMFIIAWIEDVDFWDETGTRRPVQVDTTQHHQGADLGVWQTSYPDTHSFSKVDFNGGGKIHPPVLNFDASIYAVDAIGP